MMFLTSNHTLINSTETQFGGQATVILTILYSAIFVLSITGNGAMLTVLHKRFRRKSSSDLLLLNMVISETLVVGICVPFDLISLQTGEMWVFGEVMCKILWPLQTFPYGVLVWTLMLISTERFKIVAFPMKKKSYTRKHILIVVFTWLLSLLTVTPYATVLQMKDGYCVETWGLIVRRVYTAILFTSQYAIPLIIIAVCYFFIGCKMQKTTKKMQRHISGRDRALSKRERRQKLLVRMVVLFVVVFAICMLPHHVFWLLNDFGAIHSYSYYVQTFSYVFTFASTLANPVIYFTHNSGFKKDLISIFCPCAQHYELIHKGSLKGMTTRLSPSRFSTEV